VNNYVSAGLSLFGYIWDISFLPFFSFWKRVQVGKKKKTSFLPVAATLTVLVL